MSRSSFLRVVVGGVAFLAQCSLTAYALTVGGSFAFRDHESQNEVATGVGDHFTMGLVNVSPSVGTTVTASSVSGRGLSSSFTPKISGDAVALTDISPTGYAAGSFALLDTNLDEPVYTAAVSAPWSFTASNGSDSISGPSSPDRSSASLMEFAKNVNVSGAAGSPNITWGLPGSGPSVDRMQVQVWDSNTDLLVQQDIVQVAGACAGAVGSEQCNHTVTGLAPGKRYSYRVVLENRDAAGTATRSSNWAARTEVAAAPSGSVAKLIAASPESIAQAIDTPAADFSVVFDYLFTTTDGVVTVELGDTVIGSLEATDPLQAGFETAVLDVIDASLLGQTLDLKFTLDGPTGSTVLLDNISFDSFGDPIILQNGDFESGLAGFTVSGLGSAQPSPVPLPAAAILMLSGLVGLGTMRRLIHQVG